MSKWFEDGSPEYEPYRFCWEEFANAIILMAVKDYRRALRGLKRHPDSPGYSHTKRECEMFFRSWWFRVLSDADPEIILNGIRKETAA